MSDSDSDSTNELPTSVTQEGEQNTYIQFDFYFDRDKSLFINPTVDDIQIFNSTHLNKLLENASYSKVNDVASDINYLNLGGNKKIKHESSTKIRKSFKHIRNLIKKK